MGVCLCVVMLVWSHKIIREKYNAALCRAKILSAVDLRLIGLLYHNGASFFVRKWVRFMANQQNLGCQPSNHENSCNTIFYSAYLEVSMKPINRCALLLNYHLTANI